jgi:CRP-like cAMP-binding protein
MNDVKERIETVYFKPGDILFKENEESYHFYLIHSGEAEVFKTAPDGHEIHLAVVKPGQTLGEFAVIDRLPRSATARALSEIRASKIDEETYQILVKDLPIWALSMMRGFVARLRHMNDVFQRHQVFDPETRQEIEATEFDKSVLKQS